MLPIKAPVKVCLLQLFDELMKHDGFGTLKVDMRLLRRGQKEVIIDCGKQYRFVVDFQPQAINEQALDAQALNAIASQDKPLIPD